MPGSLSTDPPHVVSSAQGVALCHVVGQCLQATHGAAAPPPQTRRRVPEDDHNVH